MYRRLDVRNRRDLQAFVLALPVAADRREVVRLELEDHVFESMAELEAGGFAPADAERRAVEALGSTDELRARLLATEQGFAFGLREALVRGGVSGVFCSALAIVASGISHPALCFLSISFAVMWVVLLAFPRRMAARERRSLSGRRNVAIYSALTCGLPFAAIILGHLVANDELVNLGALGWTFTVATFVACVVVDAIAPGKPVSRVEVVR